MNIEKSKITVGLILATVCLLLTGVRSAAALSSETPVDCVTVWYQCIDDAGYNMTRCATNALDRSQACLTLPSHDWNHEPDSVCRARHRASYQRCRERAFNTIGQPAWAHCLEVKWECEELFTH